MHLMMTVMCGVWCVMWMQPIVVSALSPMMEAHSLLGISSGAANMHLGSFLDCHSLVWRLCVAAQIWQTQKLTTMERK
jgi:hypothetical protein